MAQFDEAWVAGHSRRIAEQRGHIQPPFERAEFTLPILLKLPNRTSGQHWSTALAYRKTLLTWVAPISQRDNWALHSPMPRARVTITRFCLRLPDADNAAASVKPLVDILLRRTKTHPHSLGLIENDDPSLIELAWPCVKVARRAEQRTVVLVERM